MIFTLFFLFVLAFTGTGCLRYYAIANNVLDIPNHRSSHAIPTPRGGGLAFVIVFLTYLTYLAYSGSLSLYTALTLIVPGLGLVCLGFIDDHRAILPKYRLMTHFFFSALALFTLGGMPEITFLYWTIPAGLFCNFIGLLYLVWFINLYNFMDGINGLAAFEAISICLGGALLYFITHHPSIMLLPLALATVAASFLCWNFPKARIFMGDAGSGFLGIMIGLFSIIAASIEPQLFWGWLVLSGVFIVDATLTLFHRIIQGEPLYKAHRSHAYQCAADLYNSHLKVTLGIVAINTFWLLPMALLTVFSHLDGFIGLIIAYIPLVIIVIKLKYAHRQKFQLSRALFSESS